MNAEHPSPLDFAFINKQWEIINRHTMLPYTEKTFFSNRSAREVIEDNADSFQGWQELGLIAIELD